MNVLVVGSGGREHAICDAVRRSSRVKNVFCAPGNGGTLGVATNLAIRDDDVDGLLAAAIHHRIDVTIVGPEGPLCAGVVDRFQKQGLSIFGPTAAAARIEGDKGYAKKLMKIAHVPAADGRVFDNHESAREYVSTRESGLVVKAAGLAGGKGVFVCHDSNEGIMALEKIMTERVFGSAGDEVVIEELLKGPELSVFAVVSGKTIYVLETAQDYKRLLDGDEGPNTGGMGAISPSPLATPEVMSQIEKEILVPIVDAMNNDGSPFMGILYAGLMLTPGGPKVLEFNCRFGDPEAQVMLPRLESDFMDLVEACISGTLDQLEVRWKAQSCVGVVMASQGYPAAFQTGRLITGLDDAALLPGVSVYHAATTQLGKRISSTGGRVLVVTGLGETPVESRELAYRGVESIRFDNAYYRHDIGLLE